MAGIVATSATTNNSGDTAVDKAVAGYLTSEQVALTTDPTGTSYAWTLSSPAGSSTAVLTSTSAASPKFTPDVEGLYAITCDVDGTQYVMRLSVVNIGTVATIGALRLQPLTDNQVPTPTTGQTLYYSSTQSSLAIKKTDGSVETLNTTSV